MAGRIVDIEVFGVPKLRRQLKNVQKSSKRRTDVAMRTSAQLLIKSIQLQMKGSRSRAERFGRKPTAAPNRLGIDTGTLRRSIGSRGAPGGIYTTKRTRTGLTIIAGTSLRYGPVHEQGLSIRRAGRGRTRMPKRPFFDPGIRKALPAVRKLMERAALRVRV